MQVVKAIYQAGNIQLISPLVGVEEAELLIVVLDKEGETGIPAAAFRGLPGNSEPDFKALGITHFFDTDEDRAVDWEEVFDVKPR